MAFSLPRRLLAYLFAVALLCAPRATLAEVSSPAPDANTPTGPKLYRQMVAAMAAAPEPSTLQYTLDVRSTWMSFDFVHKDDRIAAAFGIPGDTAPGRFHVGVNGIANTGYAERVDAHDAPAAAPVAGSLGTRRSPYPVTLTQVFKFVHTFGDPASPPAAPSPQLTAAPHDDRLADIGHVIVATDYEYEVTNMGSVALNGHPVYHLRFNAIRDRRTHPITDAFVDQTTILPRRIQADFTLGAAPSVHFAFTFDFERLGAFWVAETSRVESRVQAAFLRKSGSLDIHVTDVKFDAPIVIPTPERRF